MRLPLARLTLALSAALLSAAIQAAGIVTPAPSAPAILTLATTLNKACEPYYPADFTPEDAPGSTKLQVYVSVTGAITSLNIAESSGSVTLDQAAVECLKNLGTIYRPASIGTLGIASWQRLEVNWAEILKALPKRARQGAFFELH
jgi:TonB family protein